MDWNTDISYSDPYLEFHNSPYLNANFDTSSFPGVLAMRTGLLDLYVVHSIGIYVELAWIMGTFFSKSDPKRERLVSFQLYFFCFFRPLAILRGNRLVGVARVIIISTETREFWIRLLSAASLCAAASEVLSACSGPLFRCKVMETRTREHLWDVYTTGSSPKGHCSIKSTRSVTAECGHVEYISLYQTLSW